MKVLYAIQGTGNGHLSRSKDVIPALLNNNIDLDILISGIQADISIPYDVKYRLKGLSFIFGKKGGVDMWGTYLKSNTARLQKEIKSVPIEDYDLIINDFEPVSAWACKLKNKKSVSFSHQAAVLSPSAPKPSKNDVMGKFILKKYAPTTTQYGLHFKPYENNIYAPIIRKDIREANVKNKGHYTVYLPAYSDDKVLKMLSKIKGVEWQVFSKHNTKASFAKNISIQPITNNAFVSSMASSAGILCGAGFEAPAEALYLNKKLLVVPMKSQFEQQCNAAALKEMGVPVIKSLKKKHLEKMKNWIEGNNRISVDYPNQTQQIVNQLLEESV